MSQLLSVGQEVYGDASDLPFRIEEYLGSGSQGEVYRASAQAGEVAVKWFYSRYVRQDTRLEERLERAVQIGSPSESFLWPFELIRASDADGFGYVMGLREVRYRGMAELVSRQIESSFRALSTAAFELANAFLQLHARGLCYRDISFGNVFFDPATGQVQICDNDNVDIDGQPGSIGGTARFMAPELVTGSAAPTTQSDLFSLAVLLFYVLVNHHPLEGAREAEMRCFDLPAMTRLYGSEPRFIFDPEDESNRPVPGLHDNALAFWPIYPEFLSELFTRAFTDGIRDPQQGRVRESEWRSAMIRLRDAIFYCPGCAAENFYDAASVRRLQGAIQTDRACWSCGQLLQLPPRIRITQSVATQLVMLNHDTRLFGHHIDPSQAFRFDEVWAEVRAHPTHADVWGLANLSNTEWTATTASGETVRVPPGLSITLSSDLRVHFGPSEGEVRV